MTVNLALICGEMAWRLVLFFSHMLWLCLPKYQNKNVKCVYHYAVSKGLGLTTGIIYRLQVDAVTQETRRRQRKYRGNWLPWDHRMINVESIRYLCDFVRLRSVKMSNVTNDINTITILRSLSWMTLIYIPLWWNWNIDTWLIFFIPTIHYEWYKHDILWL